MKWILIIMLGAMMSCDSSQPIGDCVGEPQEGGCYQVYDPVCGCDNKTYGNGCMAGLAGVKNYVKGECKQ
jgi:hypothetical protein